MKRFFIDNIGWKLLALGIAALLWVGLASEPELATAISAPIFFRNMPDDLDVSSEPLGRVHMEIRGPARRLSPESLAQSAVVLNLSDVQPGERTFTIDALNIRGLPIGVEFYRAVPSQIRLRFERLLTRDVTIEPVYSKPPPNGYSVVKAWLQPDKARLRGPEGPVQSIQHVNTDPIDLSGIVGHSAIRVLVHVGDPQVRLESSPAIMFNVEMQKGPSGGSK